MLVGVSLFGVIGTGGAIFGWVSWVFAFDFVVSICLRLWCLVVCLGFKCSVLFCLGMLLSSAGISTGALVYWLGAFVLAMPELLQCSLLSFVVVVYWLACSFAVLLVWWCFLSASSLLLGCWCWGCSCGGFWLCLGGGSFIFLCFFWLGWVVLAVSVAISFLYLLSCLFCPSPSRRVLSVLKLSEKKVKGITLIRLLMKLDLNIHSKRGIL